MFPAESRSVGILIYKNQKIIKTKPGTPTAVCEVG